MAKKGLKSTRGRPEMYSEVKTSVCLALTRTAIAKLDELAKSMQLSRSEFIEQAARGLINFNLRNK
ncbi:MAG: ribbon-helix-helix domain-containing protein [Drouetiella hepatica Uher 2000/2452]|jgi:metal-responsive CopG/Arc/MetJ family transcriptional regulator|uniref:Ribbon-helix-helix domain-containing protein n=1 Tax=Drouetiella hepatica Uher 2000/2452 TaxID=904376 RepID=A0A951UPP4_9CYAN|nr:ribbon-helix-helix domain-containing protein [Drouetiella hepatica Uher 2000/2452]